jgi:endoglucanase
MHRVNDLASRFWRGSERLHSVVLIACAVALTVGLTSPAYRANQEAVAKRATGATARCSAWPLWQRFSRDFIQADGRVIDRTSARKHSTSEGQAYSMFFALIAGDREQFDRLWRWSLQNLVVSGAASQLPAWQWGQRDDGSWGVVDGNSASDANLWLVYSLVEAARLWGESRYLQDAKRLLVQIAAEEVAELPGFGLMLLPARAGFTSEPGRWRLNPSYMPLPVLRRLAQVAPEGPWQAIAVNTVRMMDQSTPLGFAADWVVYQAAMPRSGQFLSDMETGDLGSYDAIRTYLWAGMVPPGDALRTPLLAQLGGMARALRTQPYPPEKVQVRSAILTGTAPVGFSAAMLPYLRALNQTALLQSQRDRVKTALLDDSKSNTATYYDHVLGLFGTGWDENWFRFLPSGKLKLRLETACPPTAATR